jgi:hypothetical protein
MRIESNSKSFGINGLSSRGQVRGTRPDANPPGSAAPERPNQVNQVSTQTATVRPEKIARAKALLADSAYPSEASLGKVADLLASHLEIEEG